MLSTTTTTPAPRREAGSPRLPTLVLFLLVPLAMAGTACASGSAAWDLEAEPQAIPLATGADTLSAASYYRYGVSVLEDDPEEAVMAFRWASRLDPTWASPLYGLRTALLMSDLFFFDRYRDGGKRLRNDPRTATLDTLFFRALSLNPFLERHFDAVSLRFLIKEDYRKQERSQRYGGLPLDESVLDMHVTSYLRRADDAVRAWIAHGEGRYALAAEEYQKAVAKADFEKSAGLRADLARVRFRLGDYGLARTALDSALMALRERDEDELVRIYDSKAIFEHMGALIFETTEDMEGARDRYAAALQEDLSYAPAHLGLARLAAAEGDSPAAVAEYELALEVAPDDARTLLVAGRGLAALGHHARAAETLRTLVEREPHFADPVAALGHCLEALGEREEAAALYRQFLAMASRDNPARREIEHRLGQLGSTGVGGR